MGTTFGTVSFLVIIITVPVSSNGGRPALPHICDTLNCIGNVSCFEENLKATIACTRFAYDTAFAKAVVCSKMRNNHALCYYNAKYNIRQAI